LKRGENGLQIHVMYSETIADLFDERDPAVKWMIARAIEGAHAAGRPISICGQAPSDYPDFAEWLVSKGIDSISLNPDSMLRSMHRLAERTWRPV